MKYVQIKKIHGGLTLHTTNHYQILFNSSTTHKLRNILSNSKDEVKNVNQSGIYEINCDNSYNKFI